MESKVSPTFIFCNINNIFWLSILFILSVIIGYIHLSGEIKTLDTYVRKNNEVIEILLERSIKDV